MFKRYESYLSTILKNNFLFFKIKDQKIIFGNKKTIYKDKVFLENIFLLF